MLNQVSILLILIFTLQSCSNSNDQIYSELKNNLNDTVKVYNAEKFEFTDFKLYPQKTYFVNKKVKLLYLEGNGEMGEKETYYLFETKNDSLLYIVSRTKYYNSQDRWKIAADTIYVTDFKNKSEKKYANGKIVGNVKLKNDFLYQDDIMYDIKKHTEKKYNSR